MYKIHESSFMLSGIRSYCIVFSHKASKGTTNAVVQRTEGVSCPSTMASTTHAFMPEVRNEDISLACSPLVNLWPDQCFDIFKPKPLTNLQMCHRKTRLTLIPPLFMHFRCVRKNCEKRLLASSCLSVRMEQFGSHWTNFDEIWYLNIFWNSIEKIQV
jgi:hypothetical protein